MVSKAVKLPLLWMRHTPTNGARAIVLSKLKCLSSFMNILVKYFVCLFKSCENMDEQPCQHVLHPQCVTLTGCKLWCCICPQVPREAGSLVVEREEQGVWSQWCLVELLSLQAQLLQSIPLGLHSQTYCLHLNPVLGLLIEGQGGKKLKCGTGTGYNKMSAKKVQ